MYAKSQKIPLQIGNLEYSILCVLWDTSGQLPFRIEEMHQGIRSIIAWNMDQKRVKMHRSVWCKILHQEKNKSYIFSWKNTYEHQMQIDI